MKIFFLPTIMMTLMLSSCGGTRIPAKYPESHYQDILADQRNSQVHTEVNNERPGNGSEYSDSPLGEPDSILTLRRAIILALEKNPILIAASYNIRSAEARTVQAGLFPNPELGIEVENFAGSGAYAGMNNSETTIAISQQILLSGRRSRAVEAAVLESDLVAWDIERLRLDIVTEVRRAFADVLLEQKKLNLHEDQVELSKEILRTISTRVKAGRVSPAEESRARVSLARSEVQVQSTYRRLASSRNRLSSLWGDNTAIFRSASGDLQQIYNIPPEQSLKTKIADNPDIRRFETALQFRQAVVNLENAKGKIDPTVSGGFRRLGLSGDNAVVIGFSVPLPFSDRNQGFREESLIELDKTKQMLLATDLRLKTEFTRVYNNLMALQDEITAERNVILPEAQSAFETINDGYVQGRFSFLDVLSAQQTLFEARERNLDALAEFHHATAEMERLIAQGIENLK